MPPLKTYTYENVQKNKVIIMAYTEAEAQTNLNSITKEPFKFKLIQ